MKTKVWTVERPGERPGEGKVVIEDIKLTKREAYALVRNNSVDGRKWKAVEIEIDIPIEDNDNSN